MIIGQQECVFVHFVNAYHFFQEPLAQAACRFVSLRRRFNERRLLRSLFAQLDNLSTETDVTTKSTNSEMSEE